MNREDDVEVSILGGCEIEDVAVNYGESNRISLVPQPGKFVSTISPYHLSRQLYYLWGGVVK